MLASDWCHCLLPECCCGVAVQQDVPSVAMERLVAGPTYYVTTFQTGKKWCAWLGLAVTM